MTTKDPIDKLLDPDDDAKSFAELLADGVPHKGGLAQLAQAEQEALARSTGERRAPSASIASIASRRKPTLH
jgi:hypothetical protein